MSSPLEDAISEDADGPARLAGSDFFAFAGVSEAIHTAFIRRLAKAHRDVVASYLPPENVQRFRHGDTWQNPGAENPSESGMQEHSAIHATGFDQVVEHDLGMMARAVDQLTQQMHRQFAHMFYSTIEEGADRVGNTVDAANLPLEEAYYRGLETVQVMAEPDGSIRWPEVRGGGDLWARMSQALEAATPEFKARLEALKTRKAQEARDRELERQRRFVKYGE